MLKKSLAVAALAALPVSQIMADDDVGCGAGTILWEGQSGVVAKVLAATTNGTFGNQTFGISTGTLGCSSDGVIKAENRLTEFAGANLDQLSAEMAAGQGESMSALAALYGVESADRAQFNAALKANYANIFSSVEVTAAEVLGAVEATLASDQGLAQYVA
ncbi:MAG: DUF3015 family protein [Panacagrimonas sp.]